MTACKAGLSLFVISCFIFPNVLSSFLPLQITCLLPNVLHLGFIISSSPALIKRLSSLPLLPVIVLSLVKYFAICHMSQGNFMCQCAQASFYPPVFFFLACSESNHFAQVMADCSDTAFIAKAQTAIKAAAATVWSDGTETLVFGGLLNSLSGKVQSGLLVLGLARETVLPRESQHVLHSVVDTQSAGVVEWGAALIILAVQQGLHAVMLRLDAPETHTHTHTLSCTSLLHLNKAKDYVA